MIKWVIKHVIAELMDKDKHNFLEELKKALLDEIKEELKNTFKDDLNK